MTHHRTNHHPFQATGVEGLGHEHEPRFPASDSHRQSALPAEVLELLQRHAEELLRTSRDTRAQSAGATAAPIVDPWALAGTGPATTEVAGGGHARPADTLQKLLAIGEKLLAKLESAKTNPFDFLP